MRSALHSHICGQCSVNTHAHARATFFSSTHSGCRMSNSRLISLPDESASFTTLIEWITVLYRNWNTDPHAVGSRCQLRMCDPSKAPYPTWTVPEWNGWATFKLPPPPPHPPPTPPPPGALMKVQLDDAAAAGAVCLDGSAPVYYFRAG